MQSTNDKGFTWGRFQAVVWVLGALLAGVRPAAAEEARVNAPSGLQIPSLLLDGTSRIHCGDLVQRLATEANAAIHNEQWAQADQLYSTALEAAPPGWSLAAFPGVSLAMLTDASLEASFKNGCRADMFYGRATARRLGGHPAQAKEDIERARELYWQTYGADSSHVALAEGERAAQLVDAGQRLAAVVLYRHAIGILKLTLPPEDHNTTSLTLSLARVLDAQGQRSEAEGYFREVWRLSKPLSAQYPWNVFNATFGLAGNLLAQGKCEEAQPVVREGVSFMEHHLPAMDPSVGAAYVMAGQVLACRHPAELGLRQ